MSHVHSAQVVESLVVALPSGAEAVAAERGITAAAFTGIGVFSDAHIGYLDPATNAYDEHHIDEACEVTAFSGNIVLNHGRPEVHAHVSLGLADMTMRGGHLLRAHVHPTLEVHLSVLDIEIHREFDPDTGQELIA